MLYLCISIVITIIQLFLMHKMPYRMKIYMIKWIWPAVLFNCLISSALLFWGATEMLVAANFVASAISLGYEWLWLKYQNPIPIYKTVKILWLFPFTYFSGYETRRDRNKTAEAEAQAQAEAEELKNEGNKDLGFIN